LEHSCVYVLIMAALSKSGRLTSHDTTVWDYIKTLWPAKPEIHTILALYQKSLPTPGLGSVWELGVIYKKWLMLTKLKEFVNKMQIY